MLQELGASITCEPENEVDATKVDFIARFADHTIAVEATSPMFTKDVVRTARDRNRLTDFVEECVPAGWLRSEEVHDGLYTYSHQRNEDQRPGDRLVPRVEVPTNREEDSAEGEEHHPQHHLPKQEAKQEAR